MFRITYIIKTLITMTLMITMVVPQTLDEIKSQIVNDWKSIALELVPVSQGDEVLSEYQRRQWNFSSSSEVSTLIENFEDKSGSKRRMSFQGQGEVTYQGASNVVSGAYLCQFNFSKTAILTLQTDELVAAFNEAQQGQDGVTWVKDKPQDITKVAVPVFGKLSNQFFMAYDLIYIRDDYLYMGEVDALGSQSTVDNQPKGLCAPLIPFSDDETPLTLDGLKESINGSAWTSLTKEVRPSQNNQGKLITTFQTRKLTFLSESNYSLVLTSFPGPGETSPFIEIEVIGPFVWEEDASQVVAGAYFAKFSMSEFYLTPLNDDMAANLNQGLPQGMDPFKNGQKANLTGKEFPALGLTSESPNFESDLVYQRQNRLFLQARPIDGGMLYSKERRTYSLQRDLIDPERSSFNGFLILNLIIILLL